MTELISIRESSKHVDEEVRMHVWLTDKRSSGKIVFLQLRDGTAFFQGVVRKNDVSEEVLKQPRACARKQASTSPGPSMKTPGLTSATKSRSATWKSSQTMKATRSPTRNTGSTSFWTTVTSG